MPNKKRRGVVGLPLSRATTPLYLISTKRPTPNVGVSVRLILRYIESGSFDSENKRRISKIPVAPNHSVRGYVNPYFSKREIPGQAGNDKRGLEIASGSTNPRNDKSRGVAGRGLSARRGGSGR